MKHHAKIIITREGVQGDWVYLRLQPYWQKSLANCCSLKLSSLSMAGFKWNKESVKWHSALKCLNPQNYPTFHVSYLKRKVGRQIQPFTSLPPIDLHREVQLESELILDHHMRHQGDRAVTKVLIK